MKKLLLFTFLLFTGLTYAQNKQGLKDSETLTFYGVDFTKAKAYGAEESLNQFKGAFEGINSLFKNEPNKYNVSKFLKKDVALSLSSVLDLNERMQNKEFDAESNDYSLTTDDLKAMLKNLDTGSDEGYGAILYAGLLNKGKPEATYDLVLFDIATKEIIVQEKLSARARGFGLRNFWAASVLGVLKNAQKMKLY